MWINWNNYARDRVNTWLLFVPRIPSVGRWRRSSKDSPRMMMIRMWTEIEFMFEFGVCQFYYLPGPTFTFEVVEWTRDYLIHNWMFVSILRSQLNVKSVTFQCNFWQHFIRICDLLLVNALRDDLQHVSCSFEPPNSVSRRDFFTSESVNTEDQAAKRGGSFSLLSRC